MALFGCGKPATLDTYETRCWTGCHHHTALSLLALLFLVLQRRRMEERGADDGPRSCLPIKHLVDLRGWEDADIIAWSNGRMERNRIAKLCHENRRRAELTRQSRKTKPTQEN